MVPVSSARPIPGCIPHFGQRGRPPLVLLPRHRFLSATCSRVSVRSRTFVHLSFWLACAHASADRHISSPTRRSFFRYPSSRHALRCPSSRLCYRRPSTHSWPTDIHQARRFPGHSLRLSEPTLRRCHSLPVSSTLFRPHHGHVFAMPFCAVASAQSITSSP